MHDLEVGGDDLLARRPRLTAEVEVVAVDLAEGLVESQVLDRPRRDGHHEAIDRVDLAGVRERRGLLPLP